MDRDLHAWTGTLNSVIYRGILMYQKNNNIYKRVKGEVLDHSLTFEIPRLDPVEIYFSDDIEINGFVGYLLPQVVIEKLLIRGMESEAWRNRSWSCVARHHHADVL